MPSSNVTDGCTEFETNVVTKLKKLANISATTRTERVYYKIIYVMKNIVMLMLGP